jgi:hypothetical protein
MFLNLQGLLARYGKIDEFRGYSLLCRWRWRDALVLRLAQD